MYYIGVIMVYRGYMGITENEIETTIVYLIYMVVFELADFSFCRCAELAGTP